MDIAILVLTNLVTAAAFTVVGMRLTMIALSLEIVRKKISEEPQMPNTAKKRRFGRTDIILAIVIAGFIATGVNTISASNTASRADKSSAVASKDATMAVAGLKSVVVCLTGYSNSLADALDRRNADNAALQTADAALEMADAERDQTLLRLAATGFTSRSLLAELGRDTASKAEASEAKQKAIEEVRKGREEKGYPEAPRDACSA